MRQFDFGQFATLIDNLRRNGENKTLHFITVTENSKVVVNPFNFAPAIDSDLFNVIIGDVDYRTHHLFDDIYIYNWNEYGDTTFAASKTYQFRGNGLILKYHKGWRKGLVASEIVEIWDYLAFDPFGIFFVDWAII